MNFEVLGKNCEFKRLTAKEGLELKNAMLKASATNDFSVLDNLMFRALIVGDYKDCNTATIDLIFGDDGAKAISEISIKFLEFAQSFLPNSLKFQE